eukprot:scaffold1272_cov250-Pinguiococcus_pyrenoidosus.AAC.51
MFNVVLSHRANRRAPAGVEFAQSRNVGFPALFPRKICANTARSTFHQFEQSIFKSSQDQWIARWVLSARVALQKRREKHRGTERRQESSGLACAAAPEPATFPSQSAGSSLSRLPQRLRWRREC